MYLPFTAYLQPFRRIISDNETLGGCSFKNFLWFFFAHIPYSYKLGISTRNTQWDVLAPDRERNWMGFLCWMFVFSDRKTESPIHLMGKGQRRLKENQIELLWWITLNSFSGMLVYTPPPPPKKNWKSDVGVLNITRCFSVFLPGSEVDFP